MTYMESNVKLMKVVVKHGMYWNVPFLVSQTLLGLQQKEGKAGIKGTIPALVPTVG
jgi:hypothetical protein